VIGLLGITLVVFIVAVVVVASYPVMRWNDRAQWVKGEWLVVLPPYVLWAGLILSEAESNKSKSNLIVEPLILGALVGLLAWARIWLATPLGPRRAALYCGILAVGCGGVVWWLMPGMHE